jgi:hypothetical protein
MRISKTKLMLLYVAVSALTVSSCQKEEELVTPQSSPAALAAPQQNETADNEACGAFLPTDAATLGRMEQMENTVQAYIASNPEAVSGNNRTIVTVPVVFHVVYNTAEQNISDAQLQSQVAALNEDFTNTNADGANVPSVFQSLRGNANFHFALAARDPNGNATTGITRTSTSVTAFGNDGAVCFTNQGGHDAWPTGQYLNIWVCNKSGGAGYSTYPWSNSPSTDGVYVKYNYVGRVGPWINNWNYQKGRTVTHEVGHWFGLIHIWGDVACGNDLVNDTPPQGSSNSSCPTFPHMSSCSLNSNGDMYMNYMDYTNDNCRNMFSLLQVTRMLGYLNGTPRVSLLTSLGAVPPSTSVCNVPAGLNASVTSSSATLTWASTGALSYNVKYKSTSSSTWTTVSSATTSYIASGLSASAAYQFQVQSICASGSSAYSSLYSFTTAAAATTVCNVPGGLAASSIASGSAALSWASTGALGYNIRYKPTTSSVWTTIFSSTIPRTITGLLSSTTYEFQVQSSCSSGSSAYSSSAIFTTSSTTPPPSGCNVPGGLGISSVTSTTAALHWTSTGALSYNVRYRGIGSTTWAVVSSSLTSRTVSWLTAGSTYEFQVQSVCASGSSAYSASTTFVTGY